VAVFYTVHSENPVRRMPPALTSVAEAFIGMRVGRFSSGRE